MESMEAPKARQTCQGALQEETAGVRSVIDAKRLILLMIPCELKVADRSRSSFEFISSDRGRSVSVYRNRASEE